MIQQKQQQQEQLAQEQQQEQQQAMNMCMQTLDQCVNLFQQTARKYASINCPGSPSLPPLQFSSPKTVSDCNQQYASCDAQTNTASQLVLKCMQSLNAAARTG